MNPAVRLGVYVAGLAVAFTAAFGAGRLVGPVDAPAAHGGGGTAGHGSGGAGHGSGGPAGSAPAVPGGLQVSEAGYRLAPVTGALTAGAATEFAFRVLGPDGAPVTRYTPTHERRLHLIVVRRDLTGFQHLHPELGADGVWRTPLTVAAAGQYRVFADFQPDGRDRPLTLGVDVPAAGAYQPQPLPAAARLAEVDGFRVELTGDLVAGAESRLTLTVTRDGRPVDDLQPYLGAYGHLVALRDGDLGYLHVHPDGSPGDGRTRPGPEVVFHAAVPSAGTYRLFLDFQHGGVVRTAAFTAVAATRPAGPVPAPLGGGGDGHDHSHGD